jgi:uncharacterized protein YecT (DUF1311 family)
MKSKLFAQYFYACTFAFASIPVAQAQPNLTVKSAESPSKSFANPTDFVGLNCVDIQSKLEKMMCGSAEIVAAESHLRDLYRKVESQARQPQMLGAEQTLWRKKLVECKLEKCVLERMTSRTKALSTWIADENLRIQDNEKCQGKACWPEGSAMHTGYVLREQLDEVSPVLQSQFEKLLSVLSNTLGGNGRPYIESRILSAIEGQQRAWKKYIEDECELIGSLTGAGGTWPSTWALSCELSQTQRRLRDVSNVIACVEKLPVKTRWIDQNSCLRGLAPLGKSITVD